MARKTPKEPLVGIFWYYKRSLLIHAEPVSQVKDVAGFADIDMGHYQYWETLQRLLPDLKWLEYDEVPRGRVLYDTEKRIFKIYTSSELVSSLRFRHVLLTTFHLTVTTSWFQSDTHYETCPCLTTRKTALS